MRELFNKARWVLVLLLLVLLLIKDNLYRLAGGPTITG
jgi:hypothetical protein